MRVHRLELEAFGPFAAPVVLDLDEVSAAGVFLVHGPTGAGKTSLLDALCFALFADVPGARSKKSLQSDHAASGVVPRVVLEFTAAGRRLRITRSPEFTRPKMRGTGVRTLQARVTLEEWRVGTWHGVSTRPDEVAEVVDEVLGMGLTQFAKVVVLPQGDFAAFLRATADERAALLERLFDITAYADVERCLTEQRRATQAAVDEVRRQIAADLGRVEDALVGAAPEPDLGRSLVDEPLGTLPDRLDAALTQAGIDLTASMADYDRATLDDRRAAEVLQAAEQRQVARARAGRAQATLDDAHARAGARAARQMRIAAAERALGLAAILDHHDRCGQAADRAEQAVRQALATLAGMGVNLAAGDVAALDSRVAAHSPAARELATWARSREACDGRLTRLTADHRAATERLTSAQSALSAARSAAEALTQGLRQARALAPPLAEAENALVRAREVHRLAASVAADTQELSLLGDELFRARDSAHQARAEHLDLRERRLRGQAAELAGGLREGHPCPVCGSERHPHPATTSDPVAADAVEAAEQRADTLRQAAHALELRRSALTARRDGTAALLGGELTEADSRRAVEDATAAVGVARAAAAEVERLVTAEMSALATVNDHDQAVRRLGEAAAAAEGALTTGRAEVTAHDERLHHLLAAHAGCPCTAYADDRNTVSADDRGTVSPDDRLPSDLAGRHDALAATLGEAGRLVAAADAARTALDQAAADATTQVLGQGFPDAEAARAARLAPADLQALRAADRVDAEAQAAAAAVLDDPEVVAALAHPEDDLPALTDTARRAREALIAATRRQSAAQTRHDLLARMVPDLVLRCTHEAAATAEAALVRDLADTVNGLGAHNTLRMRLTAFVLAARLEKVVTLANERLAVLGDGRYVLEHSDERASGLGRSGLGLRVLDQWTGRTRDTSTLSGGESFMAALALALGLADAVREESGGREVGTLFVDEGFGTLDDDSLEDVLGVLDTLREGGRAVGVISHVADLRTRITHQIAVTKTPDGSTAVVRTGNAA